MSQFFALENNEGKIIRLMPHFEGNEIYVVRRLDNLRIEFLPSTDALVEDSVDFEVLDQLSVEDVKTAGFQFADGTRLVYRTEAENVFRNDPEPDEKESTWKASLGMVAVMFMFFVLIVVQNPVDTTEEIEKELKEHVVKVVKRKPPKVVELKANRFAVTRSQNKAPKKKSKSVNRLGALAVLGSSKNSKQKGGVNLGQVKTTAGPGLGGTAGSGGVQTSLYGKGIVAAPVGVGGNIKGGGGYGTKGKGGGKAGYGKLSLVGSAGNAPIPLGKEAIVQGGLDRDLISAVIERNKGQITFCYEQGLQGDPTLGGRVAVDFTIGSNGRVSRAGILNTTLHSKMVEDCIIRRLKSWKFPLPEGGISVKVAYPFLLRRRG